MNSPEGTHLAPKKKRFAPEGTDFAPKEKRFAPEGTDFVLKRSLRHLWRAGTSHSPEGTQSLTANR
jgi:hypothetical protein